MPFKEQPVNGMEIISTAIFNDSEAVFLIDLKNKTYSTMKSGAIIDQPIGSTGNYFDLCRSFLSCGENDMISDGYQPFVEIGIPYDQVYTRHICFKKNNRDYFMDLFFFPSRDRNFGVITLTAPRHNIEENYLTQLKRESLNENYLYSMLVDLDQDNCSNCYVSELPMAGQFNRRFLFSEWRSQLEDVIWPDDKAIFLKNTSPEQISSLLSSAKRFSFQIRMNNLSGKLITTRHSICRVRDFQQKHFMFIYVVIDISSEVEEESNDFTIRDKSNGNLKILPVDNTSPDKPGAGLSSFTDVVLNQIIQDIHRDYMKDLTLKTLGSKYFISSAYLGQLFVKKYGISFNQYLCAQRIRKAAEFLTNSNLSVTEVVARTGYSSISYFNKKFKEEYGCSPASYRRKHKAESIRTDTE